MRIIYRKNQDEDLTIEEAKTFECCKDLTDEQISELLETIRAFTEIVYYTFAQNNEQQDKGEDESSYRIAS
jgi:hypothetical protein